MRSPDGNLKESELILHIETKMLKEVKDMIYKKPMNETYEFLLDCNHECLWKVYARKALDEHDFISAEKAYLKMDDYKGLQFIKRLN